jgi:chromosome segregation ATPase
MQNLPEWRNMLKEFLDAGKTFYETVPTSVANCLDIDEWSSNKDITLASESASEDISLSDATKAIGEELTKRLAFTKSTVETLCNAVNSASGGNLGVILQTYSEERSAQAEKLLLTDQLTTCQKEVLALKAELSLTQHTLYRAERALQIATDKNQRAAASSTVAALSTPVLTTPRFFNGLVGGSAPPSTGPSFQRVASTSSVVSVTGSLSPIRESTEAVSGADVEGEGTGSMQQEVVSEDVRVLQENYDAVLKKTEEDTRMISVLQSQIDDAESRRARAERSLLEYMSRAEEEEGGPEKVKSKEATEVERVTKKLQETRNVCNKHLAEVQVEVSS